MGRVFSAYGTLLTLVSSFRHLGLTLSSTNDNWPVVERNIYRARGKWERLVKMLGREGSDNIIVGRFYVAVVQEVLLFGDETWVLNP